MPEISAFGSDRLSGPSLVVPHVRDSAGKEVFRKKR